MKFLSSNNYYNFLFNDLLIFNVEKQSIYLNEDVIINKYIDYDFYKYFIKKRKILNNVKKGVINSPKKNSIKRDKNNSLSNMYLNLSNKKGKKFIIKNSINKFLENIFLLLKFNDSNLKNFYNFKKIEYSYNNDNLNFLDLNYILSDSTNYLKSIFDIKIIKNNKKSKSLNKYSYEIVYIPKEKRIKYVLRYLFFFKNSFSNYNIWERIFWSFIIIVFNTKNSFLHKRKNYVNLKSIKFFKRRK